MHINAEEEHKTITLHYTKPHNFSSTN